MYGTGKRLIDVAGAVGILILGSPILMVAALAIWATMGRPIVFRQLRIGRGGKLFTLLKLRTMRDVEAASHADAARLTPIGRVLRAASVDELPQLWNVIRGEMSLVGPRPLLPQYLGRYSRVQARRHEVRPGITGLAQVSGRNTLTWEDKFKLDVWYVDHESLRLDLWIVWRTVASVVEGAGISAPEHATMPEFMGSGEPEAP